MLLNRIVNIEGLAQMRADAGLSIIECGGVGIDEHNNDSSSSLSSESERWKAWYSSFVYGEHQETIFMKQPDGFNGSGEVCRLNRSLYSHKQAGSCWNNRIEKFLERKIYRNYITQVYTTCRIKQCQKRISCESILNEKQKNPGL